MRHSKNVFALKCWLTLFIAPSFLFSQYQIEVLQQNAEFIKFVMEFPKPVTFEQSFEGKNEIRVLQPEVVYFQTTASNPVINAEPVIINRTEAGMKWVLGDIAIGSETDERFLHIEHSIHEQLWQIEKTGMHENMHIFRLVLYPLLSNPAGSEGQWIEKMHITISSDNPSLVDLPVEIFLQDTDALRKRSVSKESPELLHFTDSRYKRLFIYCNRYGAARIPVMLLAAMGWNIDSINAEYIRVINKGDEIPIFIDGARGQRLGKEAAIEFLTEPLWDRRRPGQKRLDVYSDYNVYVIEVSSKKGLRFGQESAFAEPFDPSARIFPRSTLNTVHFEQDRYFNRLSNSTNVDMADYWLYAPPVRGSEKSEFTFTLHSPDQYAMQLFTVKIKLRTQSQSAMAHNFDVFINQTLVSSHQWSGSGEIIIESEGISPAYLNDGSNTLMLVNRSSEGPLAQIMLDWFEIQYPRLLEAHNDELHFYAPANSQNRMCRFQIKGFTRPDISIYKKDLTRILGGEIETVTDTLNQTTYTITFEDRIFDENTEYRAVASGAKWRPDSLRRQNDPNLLSTAKSVDYIMITPSDTLGEMNLGDLITLRESQGYAVFPVMLQDIYDTFNYGISHPEGIRNFLKYAYAHGNGKPQYVVLVGNGTINGRALPEQGNKIPVPLYHTEQYGAAASDHWYVLLDGDNHYPNMAIGRFPVTTQEELKRVVEKTVQYEKQPGGEWKNRYLMIGAGGHGGIFKTQSEAIIRSIFNPGFSPQRLYLFGDFTDPFVGGTLDLLRHMRNGVAMMNFRGHGGGAIWSDTGLLDLDDIDLFENKDKLTFVTSMTCFTNDFASSRTSLGEAFFTGTDAGAVGFWGATGLGWVYNDYYMLTEFYKLLNRNSEMPVGELLRLGKINYLKTRMGTIPMSNCHQYTLLGDPALKLALPTDYMRDVKLERLSVSANQPLQLSGESPTANTNYYFEVSHPERGQLQSRLYAPGANAWQLDMPLDIENEEKNLGLRLYAWDDEINLFSHAYLPFSYKHVYIDSVRSVPPNPAPDESIYVIAVIEDTIPVSAVELRMISPLTDTLAMEQKGDNKSHYQTDTMIGPFNPGVRVSFKIAVKSEDANWTESETHIVEWKSLPDYVIHKVAFGGESAVKLQAEIRRYGSEGNEAVAVHFHSPSLGVNHMDTVYVSWENPGIASVSVQPAFGAHHITVTVNPDSSLPEAMFNNNIFDNVLNVNHFQISPDSGLPSGIKAEIAGQANRFLKVSIPESAVQNNRVLALDTLDHQQKAESWNDAEINNTIYHVRLTGPSETELLLPAQLEFVLTAYDTASSLKPYYWNTAINQWTAIDYQFTDSVITAQSRRLGYFALKQWQDTEPPHVELQVEGQHLVNGGYVKRNPVFQISIFDASGVDTHRDRLQVYINNEPVSESFIVFQDTIDNTAQISLTARPQINPGEHTISVTAHDIHGNRAESEIISFVIGSEFEIRFLGNHPNPFKYETIFAYLLTDEAEKIHLKIYTVAGRLIKTFEGLSMGSADYHEIKWDGRDDWGNEIANGVYFFRLHAISRGRSREITGKIAKLR